MELFLSNSAGTFHITELVESVQWAGDYQQCARTLDFSILSALDDKALPEIACPVGSAVTMRADGAEFSGFVISRTKSTLENTINLSCCDRGFYLKNIGISRKVTEALPEDIARELCAAYNIKAGELAATGVRISRNFPGANLWDIIRTAYVLASSRTGVKYHIGFEGAALCARAKVQDKETPVLEGKSVLIDAATTESVESMVNSVLLVDEAGQTTETLRREDDIAAYGLLQRVLKQGDSAKAQELLDDNAFSQKLSITTLGDVRLTAGRCVIIKEPYTGMSGLFWIENDAHDWKNGVHTAKLTVSFQAMMDEQQAGEEV